MRHAHGHKPCNHATRARRLRMTSLGTPQGPSVTDIGTYIHTYIQRKMRTCRTITKLADARNYTPRKLFPMKIIIFVFNFPDLKTARVSILAIKLSDITV